MANNANGGEDIYLIITTLTTNSSPPKQPKLKHFIVRVWNFYHHFNFGIRDKISPIFIFSYTPKTISSNKLCKPTPNLNKKHGQEEGNAVYLPPGIGY
jgi:hypothetical protein